MRSIAGRLRFQPSRPAPSLPHQVPNEHAENAGTRKRRHPEEGPALDPLENAIRVTLVHRIGWHKVGERDVFVFPSQVIGDTPKPHHF